MRNHQITTVANEPLIVVSSDRTSPNVSSRMIQYLNLNLPFDRSFEVLGMYRLERVR